MRKECQYPSCRCLSDCGVNRKFKTEYPNPSIRVGLIVFVLLLFFALAFISCEPKPKLIHDTKTTKDLISPRPTKHLLYREIMKNDIKFSTIVWKQAMIESGWFTSKNYRERNNLFGMKGGVKTSDNQQGYKIYPHWTESVKAYKEWQFERLTDDCTDYYQFLIDWGYHEGGGEYERKCERIKLVVIKV